MTRLLVVLWALILVAAKVQAASIALTGLTQTGDPILQLPAGSAPTAPQTPTNAHAYNLGINAALLRNPRPSPNLVSFGPESGLAGSQSKSDGFGTAASSLGGQGVGGGTGGGGGSDAGSGRGSGVAGNNGGGSSGESSSSPLMKAAFASPDPLQTRGAPPPGQPLPDGFDGSPGAGSPSAGFQSPDPLPSVPLPGSLALLSGALCILGLLPMSSRRDRRRVTGRDAGMAASRALDGSVISQPHDRKFSRPPHPDRPCAKRK